MYIYIYIYVNFPVEINTISPKFMVGDHVYII